MRRVALTILVDMVHRSKATFVFEMLDKLIDMSINDPDPAVRYHIAAQFCCRHPLVGLSGLVIFLTKIRLWIFVLLLPHKSVNCHSFFLVLNWILQSLSIFQICTQKFGQLLSIKKRFIFFFFLEIKTQMMLVYICWRNFFSQCNSA